MSIVKIPHIMIVIRKLMFYTSRSLKRSAKKKTIYVLIRFPVKTWKILSDFLFLLS